MIIFFLIFYYLFSVLFAFGYGEGREPLKWWETILFIIIVLIFSPIMFPFNLGTFIYDNTKGL